MPSPLAQLMAILPVTGTLSCILSVGVMRRIISVLSSLARDGISIGVTDEIHDGKAREIFPVSPLPTLVMVNG